MLRHFGRRVRKESTQSRDSTMSQSKPEGPFKVAAVQAAPAFLDLDAGIEKACELITEAARHDVKLLAFPETWLPGYPWWIWLGAPAWGMQFLQTYVENSLVIDSPQMQRLRDCAADQGVMVSMGFSERDAGSLYIAQALIGSNGSLISARRKLKATHVERTVFGEGDGSDLRVDDTSLGRIGQMSCWEHMQPLNRYAMFAQAEQLHVAAWPSFSLYNDLTYALGPQVNTGVSMTYAAEGQCFVVAPCAVVSPQMLERLAPNHQGLLRMGGGHARVYAPDGRPISNQLDETEEGLAIAEIDLSVIALAKAAGDPTGHYARPDATQLIHHKAPRRPVLFGTPNTHVSRSEEPPHDDPADNSDPALIHGRETQTVGAE